MVKSEAFERLDFVDALRGLAAIYVVLYHMALMPNPGLDVPTWCRTFVLTGGTGVTLFFVLSAFTLTNSVMYRKAAGVELGNFYIRRLFRIAPLFYLWMAVSWLRDYAWLGLAKPFPEVLLNFSFLYNVIPGYNESIVWAGWTIGVEMIFYALFPLIVRYVSTIGRALGFFLLSMLFAAAFGNLVGSFSLANGAGEAFFKYSFVRHLPSFAFGVLCYHAYQALLERRGSIDDWGYALVAASVFGYGSLITGVTSAPIDGLYWQAVLYGMLLLGLSLTPVRFFVNRVTRFLGKLSYSIYLNHPTLVILLVPTYRAIYALDIPLSAQYLTALIATLTLVVAVSWLTFHAIENPGINAGRKLSAVRRTRASARTTV